VGVSLDPHDRWSTSPRVAWLWAGVLLPPFAWTVHLGIAYALSGGLCESRAMWPFYLLSAVTLGIAAAGGWIAHSIRRGTADEPEEAPNSRARGRFMALSGVLLSVIFMLAILAQTIPMFVLEPCRY